MANRLWSLVDNTYATPYMTTAQGVPIYSLGSKSPIAFGGGVTAITAAVD